MKFVFVSSILASFSLFSSLGLVVVDDDADVLGFRRVFLLFLLIGENHGFGAGESSLVHPGSFWGRSNFFLVVVGGELDGSEVESWGNGLRFRLLFLEGEEETWS